MFNNYLNNINKKINNYDKNKNKNIYYDIDCDVKDVNVIIISRNEADEF